MIRWRQVSAAGLVIALLSGCGKDSDSAKRECYVPPYDQSVMRAKKLTSEQLNNLRFSCIDHFASTYAPGRDSAETIADVVTHWDCELEIRKQLEAKIAEGDQSEPVGSLDRLSRLDAMQNVLWDRAKGCRS